MSVYIIAEAGVNHNGDLARALDMVDVAAEAGADAVKFQTFRPELLASGNAPKAAYQAQNEGLKDSQLSMLRRLVLPEDYHWALVERCKQRDIEFLSTPFDHQSLRFLTDTLDIDRVKLPSGEITNGPLLLAAARSGKPIILSTGMSTLGEIKEALGVLAYGYTQSAEPTDRGVFLDAYEGELGRDSLAENVTLLHCTSEYPCPFEAVNLLAMDTLKETFSLPVGYSDHTSGIAVPVAAVARGAVVVEKHFTLDRSLPGPDHKASLEPQELSAMVSAVRQTEAALGCREKRPTESELETAVVARKSLLAATTVSSGEVFGPDNLAIKRPGNGRSPMEYWSLLGERSKRDYQEDELIE